MRSEPSSVVLEHSRLTRKCARVYLIPHDLLCTGNVRQDADEASVKAEFQDREIGGCDARVVKWAPLIFGIAIFLPPLMFMLFRRMRRVGKKHDAYDEADVWGTVSRPASCSPIHIPIQFASQADLLGTWILHSRARIVWAESGPHQVAKWSLVIQLPVAMGIFTLWLRIEQIVQVLCPARTGGHSTLLLFAADAFGSSGRRARRQRDSSRRISARPRARRRGKKTSF